MSYTQTESSEIEWIEHDIPLIVIAENIHSPSNLGLIMRTCECFGVDKLYFSGPYSNVNTDKYRKTARSSGKFLQRECKEETAELINELRAQDFEIIAIEICETSKKLANQSFDFKQKTAILIGSERHGVSEESLKLVDQCYHIEQYGKTGSLNVGMALSIALYEITKQKSQSGLANKN